MSLLAYVEVHPWWTLVYLLILSAVTVTVVAHVTTAWSAKVAYRSVMKVMEKKP